MTRARDLADGTFANDLTVDTNTLYVDSTNNRVGVGTSSPDEKLDVRGTIQVGIDGTTAGEIRFMDSGSVTEEATISSDANGGLIFGGNSGPGELIFRTGSSTERLRISSAGNLQAGATSGRGGASTGHLFKMPSGDIYFEIMGNAAGSNTDILFSDGTGGSYGVVGYDHTNDALRFFANSGERMRIDSSGRVMVGKTSTGLGNVGVELDPDGQLKGTASNVVVQYLNRTSSDGDIVEFRKDNSVVGSIGVVGGHPHIASASGYLGIGGATGSPFMYSYANALYPTTDNYRDLGTSGNRFKDLYLSGGVYLGGTGSANLLDDYEEGTWTPAFYGSGGTPTISYDAQVGYYTKIGNQVFYRMYLATSSVSGGSGDVYITGLPFTANTSYSGQIIGLTYGWATNPAGVAAQVGEGGTVIYLYRPDNGAGGVNVSWLGTGSGANRIVINGFFQTTA